MVQFLSLVQIIANIALESSRELSFHNDTFYRQNSNIVQIVFRAMLYHAKFQCASSLTLIFIFEF